MRCASLVLASLALLSGLAAAVYWYLGSKPAAQPYILPDEWTAQSLAWIESLKASLRESARLNRTAAIWTALSVVMSAASAVVDAL
jgi:hypothetical protein